MSRLYIVTLMIYLICIMQNAGLDEAQAGIKIARRSITNLTYTGDTTLKAEYIMQDAGLNVLRG